MTEDQVLFLQILEDFCYDRPSECPSEPFDQESLCLTASRQDLEGLVYAQCRAWWNDQHMSGATVSAFLGNVFLSVNRADLLREIVSACEESGIDIIAMKGTVFRDYYQEPVLRSMGDVDLIIRHEDREAMDRIMLEKIGCWKFVDNHAVWTYLLGDFMFEIHDEMFYEGLTSQVDYRAYFDTVWEHCHPAPVFGIRSPRLYVPDEEFHFLYLMAHTAKHIIDHGSGFRAYLDMVMMVKARGEELNWSHIKQELERLQLLQFSKTCFSCCEKWFHVNMPMRLDDEDAAFLNSIAEKAFDDGIFGLQNEENRHAVTAKEISHSSGPYALSAVRLIMKKLFPPYREMQLIPWYSFVDGRPWLLPAAWIYRFGYCAVKKLKHSKNLILEPFTKKREVKERQAYLRQWGL